MSTASPLHGAGALLRETIAYAPRRTALAMALLVVAAATEAFGIVMLIPLLYAIGIGGQPGDGASGGEGLAARIVETAGAVGVELGLGNVLLLFLAGVVVRAAVSWWREQTVAAVRYGFVDALRTRLYGAMGRASWEILLQRRQADLQHTVHGDVNRTGVAMLMFLQLPVTVLLAAVQVAIAMAIAPMISAAALAAGAVALAASRVLVRRARGLGQEMTDANRRLFGSTDDFLGGLRLAKAHGVEQRHVDHFISVAAAMRARQLAFTRLSSMGSALMNVGAAAVAVLLVWLGATQAALGAAELAVIVVIFARVLPLLLGFLRNAQQLANTLPAYQNVMRMQGEFAAAAEHAAAAGAPPAPMVLERALALRGVAFAYSAGQPVLQDIDLTIAAGSMTALAGPSGAGKSTLGELLLGLLRPTQSGAAAGTVLVDGEPLTGELAKRWRRSVAYVPQDPYLFHDTIRGNLLWAAPGASEAEMHAALRTAAADGFVRALPAGLDTVVGDRGSLLSGGERQRIALARALLRNPTLLLFDEATGQLDAQTERKVAAALRRLRGRTTVVAIAHRPAVLAAADRVVLLAAGRISAVGSWSELAAGADAPGVGLADREPDLAAAQSAG